MHLFLLLEFLNDFLPSMFHLPSHVTEAHVSTFLDVGFLIKCVSVFAKLRPEYE